MKRGYVDLEIGQIHYREAGQGPETLVLVPHAGRSSQMYQSLMQELASAYRVISLDVPGTGGSDTPPASWTIPEYGNTLNDALDALGIRRCALFGLHGGNKVATSMAVRRPERLACLIYAGRTHSIVPSNAERAAAFRATPAVAAVVSSGDASMGSLRLWAQMHGMVETAWWSDAAICGEGAARLVDIRNYVVDILCAGLHKPHFYEAAYAYDMEQELAALRVPTLILELCTPTEDREFGRQGKKLLELIDNASLAIMEFEDAFSISLEDRAKDVAPILKAYLQKFFTG